MIYSVSYIPSLNSLTNDCSALFEHGGSRGKWVKQFWYQNVPFFLTKIPTRDMFNHKYRSYRLWFCRLLVNTGTTQFFMHWYVRKSYSARNLNCVSKPKLRQVGQRKVLLTKWMKWHQEGLKIGIQSQRCMMLTKYRICGTVTGQTRVRIAERATSDDPIVIENVQALKSVIIMAVFF